MIMDEENAFKVAVIGSGISGLAASYMISTQSDYKVTLYEKESRVGGHTNTFSYTPATSSATKLNNSNDKLKVNVDCGFIVMNAVNYPNFLNLLNMLSVKLDKSNMSLSVSKDLGKFEYAGKDLSTLFCQYQNLFSLKFYRMLYDIVRFNTMSVNLLGLSKDDAKLKWSLKQYCQHYNYGEGFIHDYLLPFTACVWSMDSETCYTTFPVLTLVQFMANHGLLNVGKKFQWLTVHDSAQTYVDKVLDTLDDVRLNTKVESVTVMQKGRVMLEDDQGGVEFYDKVIFACHANHTLKILGDQATTLERELLSQIKFSKNVAVLHTDSNLMPLRTKAWSSWNYLGNSPDNPKDLKPFPAKAKNKSKQKDQVSLTYWMNLLQNIDPKKFGNIFITLNPKLPPRPTSVIQTFQYTHPIFSQKLIEVQARLHEIQNLENRNFLFVGAWTKYGFHEDGCTSGILAAQAIGVQIPFKVVKEANKVRPNQRFEWSRLFLMVLITFIDFLMGWVLLPINKILNEKLKME